MQSIFIYQTEDKRAYCLEKIDNNGKYNKNAACTGKYYELPSEFYIEKSWGHFVIRQHGTNNQVEIVQGNNEKPELAIFDKPRTSKNYRIPLTYSVIDTAVEKKGGFTVEIKFMDEKHKEFYEMCVTKTKCHTDPERKALFYTLGLTDETRRNIDTLYDFSDKCIDFGGLRKGWQTGATIKVCRLAFNLYNGFRGEHVKKENAAEYTPYELFCCELLPFMLEAVKIRYQEYAGLRFYRD